MVLPWPGERACMAPRPKATAIPSRISPRPISPRCSNRDRKSPRTTVPGAEGCGETGEVARAGTGVDAAALGTGTIFGGAFLPSFTSRGLAAIHSTEAFRSWGGATVGSAGYAVSAWLRSGTGVDAAALGYGSIFGGAFLPSFTSRGLAAIHSTEAFRS